MVTVVGVRGESKDLLVETLKTYPQGNDRVVSWGIHYPGALNGMPRVNGLEQLVRFGNVGLLRPEYTIDVHQAITWVREGHQVFGRRLLHTMGQDITGPGPKAPERFLKAWLDREFWVKVIPDVLEEWRLHIFQGKCIARGLKWQAHPPNRKQPVRNRQNGWLIRHDIDPPKGLRPIAKRAVESLGYDFAAVDLLVTQKNDLGEVSEAYVLEANKSPGSDPYTAHAYASAISRWSFVQPNQAP